MMSDRLEGIYPILSLTLNNDELVDHDGLEAQVEFLLAAGADGIGIGFGTEVFRLSDQERIEVIATAARALGGRKPLIAAAGANSNVGAVIRGSEALDAGADILMVTPPALAGISHDDIWDYYEVITRYLRAPVIVQDAPAFTGVTMSDALLTEIANELEHVVAIKIESTPPAPKVGRLVALAGEDASVLGGAGGIDFYHELERGAAGTIPGAAMPELFISIYQDFRAGRPNRARRRFNAYLPLANLAARSLDTFLFTQKEILRRRGVIAKSNMRTPWEEVDRTFLVELDILLEEIGLDGLGGDDEA